MAKKKAKKKAAKKVMKKTGKKAAKKKTARVVKKAASAAVSVGTPVPAFTIKSTGDKVLDLASLKGKNVVIYFYPKDSTPGCTLEGHEFTRLYKEFEKQNTEVFGVSRDSLKSHESFKAKQNYCFDLLSDDDGKVTSLFGVWKEKENYGRKYMGIERSTFLIDANGVLRKEWRGVKVNGHAEEVLDATKGL